MSDEKPTVNPGEPMPPPRAALAQPLYLITDGGPLRITGRLVTSVAAALEGAKLPDSEISGIGTIQLREQVEGGGFEPAGDDQLVELAQELLVLCRKYQTKLVVNRRVDLALLAGADGVHLGADTIRLLPSDKKGLIFGYSAHRVTEGLRAIENGFDYVLFSPVFEPLSKKSNRPTRGQEELALLCSSSTSPIIALGGITQQNVRICRVSGASGVAVITSILGQPDPGNAAAELLAAWNGR